MVVRKRAHLQTCCVKPDKETQAKREIDNVLSTETVRLVLDTDPVVVLLLILINLVFLLLLLLLVRHRTCLRLNIILLLTLCSFKFF